MLKTRLFWMGLLLALVAGSLIFWRTIGLPYVAVAETDPHFLAYEAYALLGLLTAMLIGGIWKREEGVVIVGVVGVMLALPVYFFALERGSAAAHDVAGAIAATWRLAAYYDAFLYAAFAPTLLSFATSSAGRMRASVLSLAGVVGAMVLVRMATAESYAVLGAVSTDWACIAGALVALGIAAYLLDRSAPTPQASH